MKSKKIILSRKNIEVFRRQSSAKIQAAGCRCDGFGWKNFHKGSDFCRALFKIPGAQERKEL